MRWGKKQTRNNTGEPCAIRLELLLPLLKNITANRGVALVAAPNAEFGPALACDGGIQVGGEDSLLALWVWAPAGHFVCSNVGLGHQVLVELEGGLIHHPGNEACVGDHVGALGPHTGNVMLALFDLNGHMGARCNERRRERRGGGGKERGASEREPKRKPPAINAKLVTLVTARVPPKAPFTFSLETDDTVGIPRAVLAYLTRRRKKIQQK